MSTAWPLPEPNDPPPPRKLTLHQQLVADSITNAADHGSAPKHTAARGDLTPQATTASADDPVSLETRPTAQPLEWDLSDLDPEDREHPWTEFPEPDWPDPSWPGFLANTKEPSMTYVLAVSPVFLERYPDQAASLWTDVFPIDRPFHRRDPEPDLEAEP